MKTKTKNGYECICMPFDVLLLTAVMQDDGHSHPLACRTAGWRVDARVDGL